uniref:Plant heme peroxidase family profile domain-containing protein n=1 Tax=Aegilops tauschii subsp. strangulata TaxID=200361 RepID=A0A453D696_AEGTS
MAGALSCAGLLAVVALACVLDAATAQLRQNYYASSCPSAESTVRSVISQHVQQSFAVAPGTLRLFFHDCFVRGCDASVMLMAANGDDESHSGADATLSPDAVEAINKAKAAVEALPGCAGKVSCADILAMAARDVVSLVRIPLPLQPSYRRVNKGRAALSRDTGVAGRRELERDACAPVSRARLARTPGLRNAEVLVGSGSQARLLSLSPP